MRIEPSIRDGAAKRAAASAGGGVVAQMGRAAVVRSGAVVTGRRSGSTPKRRTPFSTSRTCSPSRSKVSSITDHQLPGSAPRLEARPMTMTRSRARVRAT